MTHSGTCTVDSTVGDYNNTDERAGRPSPVTDNYQLLTSGPLLGAALTRRILGRFLRELHFDTQAFAGVDDGYCVLKVNWKRSFLWYVPGVRCRHENDFGRYSTDNLVPKVANPQRNARSLAQFALPM